MTETSITHTEVERALKRAYPRVSNVLHVDRSPLRGGISHAAREKMHVFFQNKKFGVEEMVLIAKEAPKSADKIMTALSRRHSLSGQIPIPILYVRGILLYRTLWGDELRRFPFAETPNDLPSIATEAARMLVAIHKTPAPRGLVLQTRNETDRKKNLSILNEKFPRSMARFSLTAPKTPTKRRLGLVHGDFQASNLILTLPKGKLGIIDFAAGGVGDPANDVASFLIHTELMLRGVVSDTKIKTMLNTFIKIYNKESRTLGQNFDLALSAAKFDVLLSVLGTTIAHLSPDDKNYEPVVSHLHKLFKKL